MYSSPYVCYCHGFMLHLHSMVESHMMVYGWLFIIATQQKSLARTRKQSHEHWDVTNAFRRLETTIIIHRPNLLGSLLLSPFFYNDLSAKERKSSKQTQISRWNIVAWLTWRAITVEEKAICKQRPALVYLLQTELWSGRTANCEVNGLLRCCGNANNPRLTLSPSLGLLFPFSFFYLASVFMSYWSPPKEVFNV